MRILTEQQSPAPPRPPRLLVVSALGVLVLAVAAVSLYWWLAHPGQVHESVPPRAPSTTAPAEMPLTATRVRRGALEVSADVDGATVLLDGRRLGPAPQLASGLRGGSHAVRVVKTGYLPFERKVRIIPGRAVRVRARLEPAPPPIRIDSDVAGASVFVDREYLGTTPLETTRIPPGTHHLVVSAEGHEMYSETIETPPSSGEIVVRLKDVKLDERVDVVHKHAFGSCRGRLLADLDGLHYETDHADHAFSAGLDGLERFEVNYLKKSLRLKLRGGKNYNFTEPSGDADALFVFHKAVEKIRLR